MAPPSSNASPRPSRTLRAPLRVVVNCAGVGGSARGVLVEGGERFDGRFAFGNDFQAALQIVARRILPIEKFLALIVKAAQFIGLRVIGADAICRFDGHFCLPDCELFIAARARRLFQFASRL